MAAMVVQSNELNRVVVTEKNACSVNIPFPAAQAVFSPPPGETVAVQQTYEDFVLVKDPAGRTGWLSKTQITPIIPAHP